MLIAEKYLKLIYLKDVHFKFNVRLKYYFFADQMLDLVQIKLSLRKLTSVNQNKRHWMQYISFMEKLEDLQQLDRSMEFCA